MESNWRIADLIKKHLQDGMSGDERSELEAWLSQSEGNRTFFHRFEDPAYVARELQLMSNADTDASLDKTLALMGVENKPAPRLLWRKYAVAAALVLAVAIPAYFLLKNKPAPVTAVTQTTPAKDIAAGGDKAVLTLADGSQIVLDNAANGELAQQGATKVLKQNGQIKYSEAAKAKTPGEGIVYNTVSTPKGGQYQLVLQDGTKVWLNAASTLRFPAAFSARERQVELTGEGYFEVKTVYAPPTPFDRLRAGSKGGQKKIPFKVLVRAPGSPLGAGGEEVEVLGTHFNIMAYNDEPQLKTTLLEGSVAIRTTNNSQRTTILSPGQQSQLSGSGAIRVEENADVEQAVAWKNGMQSFRNADIQAIMRQVARWYNVQVEFQGSIPPVEITGKIPRTISLKKVLEALELNSSLHFKLDNGMVTVTP